MATFVLTAVGTALGGPIGGAIGALLGQRLDQAILAPKGREGPRLQDLRIQGSSYGTPLPRLFGTMRVAGTVIWATDLVETRARQGGGKGRAATTRYSYSCSFAVLLSARPIRAVRRVWADGELLRGAAGDWKSEVAFRLHAGGAEQAPDPLIAAIEGPAPAYRDCAYAVFEHMPLAAFGNRIPTLSFEVEADPGPVALGDMIEALSEGALEGKGAGPLLAGFAAGGTDLGGLIALFDAATPVRLAARGAGLALADPEAVPVPLGAHEIHEERRDARAGSDTLPVEASLAYFDPARDYQTGLQRARRPGPGRALARIELPAALEAGTAKALAAQRLASQAAAGAGRTVRCGWNRLALAPGDRVATPDGAVWRVAGRTIARDGVTLELAAEAHGARADAVADADAGRSVIAADAVHGPTVVHLLDLPILDDSLATAPRLLVAAAGRAPGWKRATLLASVDDGASWEVIGETGPPATIGVAASALAPATEFLIDRAGDVVVELLHAEMLLADADPGRLAAGANAALLGDEIVQFGRATPLGGRRWRLSELLRGRRGTGWAAARHQAGECFVLLEPDSLFAWDPPMAARGGTVRLLASGIGDASPVEARADAIGAALRPPPPARLAVRRQADGSRSVSWARASRLGFRWLDGVDAPLGEEREAYRLTVTRADGRMRSVDLDAPGWAYSRAEMAEDRRAGGRVELAVVQRGTAALSRPAACVLFLDEE